MDDSKDIKSKKNYNYFVIIRYLHYFEVIQCYLKMDLDYLQIYIANSRSNIKKKFKYNEYA